MSVEPDFDYLGNVQRIGLVMNALASIDLDQIIATTDLAHAVGWAIDPTQYIKALDRGDMDHVADLARALLPAVKIWREKIEPKIGATT